MLAMKLYPEVQAKAQAELDRVVGDRLPTAADKESLPYLNAVLRETVRWHPVGPNGEVSNCVCLFSRWTGALSGTLRNGSAGVPHRLMQDDVYNGYAIPAGTHIFVNVWYAVKW